MARRAVPPSEEPPLRQERQRRPRIHPLPLAIAIWAAWFVLLYGGHAVGCAVAAPAPELGARNALNGALALLTLAAFGWLLGISLRQWREARDSVTESARFSGLLNGGVCFVAALSTLVIGAPLAGYPPCV